MTDFISIQPSHTCIYLPVDNPTFVHLRLEKMLCPSRLPSLEMAKEVKQFLISQPRKKWKQKIKAINIILHHIFYWP